MAGVGHIWSYSKSRSWRLLIPGGLLTVFIKRRLWKGALGSSWRAILAHNEKIMAARCGGIAIYLASDMGQLALCAGGLSRLPLWASRCFLVREGAGAKLQRQTLLSSGHTVCKHKGKKGAFKSFGTHKNTIKEKTNEEIKHFLWKSTDASFIS